MPGAATDTFVPMGLRSRVRGEFIQRQRRIIIYAVDNRELALHVLLHEIGHHVFFLTLNSRVKKRWVTELYPSLPATSDRGGRNAARIFPRPTPCTRPTRRN